MSVEASSSVGTASNAVQVNVLHKQSEQLKAVVGTILQGVEESAQVRQGFSTGQRLNLAA